MVFGKISMDGRIRLESIQFPDAYLKERRSAIRGSRASVKKCGELEKTAHDGDF